GKYMYRYFMEPELDWWVGNNALITSTGVGLLKAAEILNDDRLAHLAQRQLDWVQGANPFNYSTMIGVGFNGHKHFDGSTFLPGTPVIPGAVLNGIGGDHDDMPDLKDGSWQTCEYWTPMVAYTLWLMAEISNSESN
ncbi:MAG: glycoside hydrolase family 9 protein, partial [Cyclobacteriaceae bacterium]|nr:glycoside hydrolase family 9 protein [Cyclobacteriaceae bacterium]